MRQEGEELMSKETMKLALEALKQIDEAMPFPIAKLAQAALREALAEQPAQQALDKMAENARELGIQMQPKEPRAWFTVDELNAWADKKLKENPQWAEQPAQQEPVAWMTKTRSVWKTKADETDTPLYTSPPAQRIWVGLTDEEFQWIYDHGRTPAGMMELVEAKLKEKNT